MLEHDDLKKEFYEELKGTGFGIIKVLAQFYGVCDWEMKSVDKLCDELWEIYFNKQKKLWK